MNDLDAVAMLVAQRFPAWVGLPLEDVRSDGTVHRIVRVGEVASIRIPLHPETPVSCTVAAMRADAEAAAEFAAVSPFPSPRPLGVGDEGSPLGLPWAAQTWLPGRIATPTGPADSPGFADDLVTLVSALREADTRGRRFERDGRGGDLRAHDAWVATCLREIEALPDGERLATDRLGALWSRLRDLPREDPDAMTHGDLIPPNLLVRDGRLTGVLDTGGYGPADPALDLVAAWHLLDGDRRERMRSGLRSPELAWRRGAAWALEQALGLVWYYRETLPGMSALGRITLGRLLDDPDL